jgi:hypothetical protein
MKKAFQLYLIFLLSSSVMSQDCISNLQLKLINIRGGFYNDQIVTFTAKGTGEVFTEKSNNEGLVEFALPCDMNFDVKISNFTQKLEMRSSPYNGGLMTRQMSYEPNMAEKDKIFAMSKPEQEALDNAILGLPEMTIINNGRMRTPSPIENYSSLTIQLKDFKGEPLVQEEISLFGEKRKKTFTGKTDANGKFLVYLPKGDRYSINFKFTPNYNVQEVLYTNGISNRELTLSYIGTKELLRRKKAEEERIIEEEKRLAAEKAEFEAYCKRLKISEEEGHKRRLEESYGYEDNQDTVVSATLNRNRWSEKLIVCDLTGSMDPYASQLALWYDLNYRKEKNLQFVFFNDGDDKSDESKVIGNTGGIYYQNSKGIDSLKSLMSFVQYQGNGGDCAENNMEALIKGVQKANPYKELVMIVDNNAPVKDIRLLKDFNRPVHIILCGSTAGNVLLDYLLIAWKTKGSIHTIEEDIFKIAQMSEGDFVKISGKKYQIMGGQFYLIE